MAGDTAASAHSTVLDPSVNIPTAASTSTPPHVQDTSPKSSPDSNDCVLVTGTTEYTLVAANPEVVTKLAVLPGDPSSTTKAQEIPKVAHDAIPVCIPMVPITCSTECSTHVDAIDIVDEAHDAATAATEVCNTTTALGPELAIDLCNTTAAMGVATCGHHDKFDRLNIPVKASISPPPHVQLFRNHDMDVQPPTRHEGLLIRPTPWPSYLVHHSAEENELDQFGWLTLLLIGEFLSARSVEYLKDLFLLIDEQSRKWDTTRNHGCNINEHWNLSDQHILEHATVGSISMGDKLQMKIQFMSLSVHQKLLSQWKFKWSGHTVSGSRPIMQVVYSYEFQSNSVVFATASSATRLACLQINTWPDYLLSSNVAIPMLCAIFSGQKTVMLCSWVATLVQQHISKIFHGLPSSSSNLKSELLVRDVCGAMPHELVIYIYHQLDITDSHIAKYIGRRSLFGLHSDYLLTYNIDLLGFDMSIDQLGTSWDRGELALLLLLEFTRRAVPQGGRGIIFVAAVFAQGYADHEYHLGFNRGCTDNGYVLDTFDQVSFSHNNYFSLVQVYADSDQGQEHQVQWDPGQAAFQGGRDVRDLP
ncbi:uncharacterized protein [Aegilops tauschii subsp. strangulata]|uniref:uncharacterized protein n=1 Tax=Aegilops tauschii subsp. strangulata TaxID=200361 RepID=UPI003CC846D7